VAIIAMYAGLGIALYALVILITDDDDEQ